MTYRHAIAAIALSAVASQPCLAADLTSEAGVAGGRMGAFAGLRIAMPLGGAERAVPRARLQIAPSFAMADARSGAFVASRTAAGLQLGMARTGAPALSFGDRSAPELRRRLGLRGSTTYIVIGGAVLVVALLAAVASAAPTAGPHEGAFQE